MVCGVVASFIPANSLSTEVADEATVGVCIDDLLVDLECRPDCFSAGDFCRIASKDLRNRFCFLGFLSDIFGDPAVLGSAGRVAIRIAIRSGLCYSVGMSEYGLGASKIAMGSVQDGCRTKGSVEPNTPRLGNIQRKGREQKGAVFRARLVRRRKKRFP